MVMILGDAGVGFSLGSYERYMDMDTFKIYTMIFFSLPISFKNSVSGW
jgi:hypothetical protein